MNICRSLFGSLLILMVGTSAGRTAVLTPKTGVHVNEIMHHPASGNLGECFIELYNSGTTPTNLSGWRLSDGVDFILPTNTLVAPGSYLVIAADPAAFTNRYPGVTNFLAGWSTPMGSHIQLKDLAGQTIDDIRFGNDGDWAARILTTNGFVSFGHAGWIWFAPHDGQGSSLELMNGGVPNELALNWSSSVAAGGTPGQLNSVARTNIAPVITAASHIPAIPTSTDLVTVSARVLDEQASGVSVTLAYREANSTNPPSFTVVSMADDGAHNDGLAGDGIYGAILPARPEGTVVEFFLEASDAQGNTRTYPNVIPPPSSSRTANLLYQVDSSVYGGTQPVYRLVMTEMERAELYAIGRKCPDSDSDAQMNATWVTTDGVSTGGTTTQVRYNIGVRNRGHGTRTSNPNNYHVNIPADRAWKGVTGINLNSQYSQSQVLGSAVFRRLEIPMAESRLVQLRVNGTNLMSLPGLPDNNSFGCYAANEQYDNDFFKRAFCLDPLGNAYRGIRDPILCQANGIQADLSWRGASYTAYTNLYFKQNAELQNDWSDLLDLVAVLNNQNGYTSPNYTSNVQRRLNVDQWMKYMAVNTLLDNTETCLANGVGDDYALYRGSNDTRFVALPYDLDSSMGRGVSFLSPRHNILAMTNVPAMDRFVKEPSFAPLYFSWLKRLADTEFAPARMNALLDQTLAGSLPAQNLENFKAYNASQVAHVLSQIPLELTVSNSLPLQNGYPRTTTPSVALWGSANIVETRAVLVNGSPAAWTAWQGHWTNANVALFPGLNRIVVQSLNANGIEFARTTVTIWYDDGSVQTEGGTISANTTWTAAGGPYLVSSTLTIASGATLTIEPGTSVYLQNANFTVGNGGRLLAEGTPAAPILFMSAPGGAPWGGFTINGAPGSPETRIAYAWFEGNTNICIEVQGGTLYLDHSSFGTTTHQYLSLDNSSFLVSGCVFPTTSAAFELVHGTGGIKTGGRGIFRDCFFGTTTGYNDIMDFTGGNREQGQAIIEYYNNVFSGGPDDLLDLDGTDAWIEGNIFLHVHKNGAPDSSSAVSGGNTGADTSQITVIGNLFYDCDQAATAKQGNFYTMLNNTIVRMTRVGGLDTGDSVLNVRDFPDNGTPTTFGAGGYLEGNIIVDATNLVRNYDSAQTTVTFVNNILPVPWNGPGTNNRVISPLLRHMPDLSQTWFTNWQSAQVLREWFALAPGSPGLATGPNGQDLGGVVPIGASVSGAPSGTNNSTSASLTVGVVRTGFGIPASGWPQGSGYTHYKYRLDDGAWSAERALATPISLSGLADGPHHVDVIGKRDSGHYQDDPELGPDAVVTSTHTWVVDPAYVPPTTPKIRLNEVLALNSTTLTNAGATPDLVEFYNYGPSTVDLSGMGLTTSPLQPYKFTFPPGTSLLPGKYLVVYADSQFGAPGIHLGFALSATGETLSLCDRASAGGALVDSVVFGLQLRDLSIGRGPDGHWVLCTPTLGGDNIPLGVADPGHVRINEWLADSLFLANHDFVELFNPATAPAPIGGCYLSDAEGAPTKSPIAPLSFVGPNGYTTFIADGNPSPGADHVNFKLDPNVGMILLSDPFLNPIDVVTYGPQSTDVSQGRSPSGSDVVVNFPQPTAGGPNYAPNGVGSTITNVVAQVVPLITLDTAWRWNDSGGTNLGTTWINTNYTDGTWSNGFGLFGQEDPGVYPYAFRTPIPAPKYGGHIAVYFRTHFQWDGSLTNYTLVSTNYVDDGAVYYLNGKRIGAIRMPDTVFYYTVASGQPSVEGTAEIVTFTNKLVLGDNVLAVELHQINNTSSDDVFGMQLNAVQLVTNIITVTPPSMPVVLNEVLAANLTLTNTDGSLSDWVELHNPGTNAVELADLSLTDDSASPRKFVFPPGTTLAPGGFLRVFCNGGLPVSTNNTGFSLDAQGDQVFLFNSPAAAGGLLDAVSFGLQVADLSIGRVPDGTGAWGLNTPTPEAMNSPAGLGSLGGLAINEWMADPLSGSDWFEVCNLGPQPLSLGGLFFTSDLAKKTMSPVPPLSFLGSGPQAFTRFQADNNPGAGADHVRFKLGKTGDSIGLYSPAGTLVTGVTFGAQLPGVSQGRFPDGSANIVSFPSSVSPAGSNFLPLDNVVVNEVLTHTDPPFEDAIEFYNPTAQPVTNGGWFISNSQDNLRKFRVPEGRVIPPHGYQVVYEYEFNSTNSAAAPFTFNSAHGDRVYLSQADGGGALTGYRAVADVGAAANGVSFGRYTNSVGQVDIVPLSSRTFGVDNPATLDQFRSGAGAPNSAPLVGPLVISEIMFFPPLIGGIEDDTQNEYLELRNTSGATLSLFDPLAPTNTWRLRGGVEFDFPMNATLPPDATLLVVNFDPAADPIVADAFRARYNLSPAVPLYGPYNKHLSNTGETLELFKPDPPQLPPHPDAGFVPYVLVERVHYLGVSWPMGAEGTGLSLHRVSETLYGNDPGNWAVAAPNPGLGDGGGPVDANHDGLPDQWQVQYFGSANSPDAAPGADPDRDGFTNAQEYLAGTLPNSAGSFLKLESVVPSVNGSSISFVAVAGKTYTITTATHLDGAWSRAGDVPAQATTGMISVQIPEVPSSTRYYRLVTPKLP
jgi:hypothetical protein